MALDSYCPEKIILPRKKHPARIEYTADGQAEIEATVQELYDFPGSKLRVCLGKVPMVICIQSPARRTQQRTTDLDAFWKGSYEGVKKELRGRYPRHEWR
jgi:ATP-dependent helicase HrpB